MLSMSAIDRKGQKELNIGKAFINTRRVNSAKFGYEAHFMSFAAIVASRNGTDTLVQTVSGIISSFFHTQAIQRYKNQRLQY
jgi:hypothetical protein